MPNDASTSLQTLTGFGKLSRFLDTLTPAGDRARTLEASLRALNSLYLALMLVGMPITVWTYLWVDFRVQGLVFLALSIAYLPILFGWFPRTSENRLRVVLAIVVANALGINSIWDWEIMPGLYVLAIPMMIAYIALGFRQFAVYWLLTAAILVATQWLLGQDYPNRHYFMLIAISTWAVFSAAGVSIIFFLLKTLAERTERLEQQSLELASSEEEARQLNQSMARMFKIISHELRTPAASIFMLSAKQSADDTATRDINGVAEHLLHVIDDLRMAVAPDTSIPVNPVPVKLGELKESLEAQTTYLANNAGISLIFKSTADDLTVLVDPYRMRTVISNLVRNALIHSEGKNVVVAMACETDSTGQVWLMFSVDDDGRGIQPQDRDKIFHLFERARSQSSGTGVGLFLASQWASSLGGSISLAAHSELGGACFEVSVPVIPVSALQADELSAPKTEAVRQWMRGKSVLIVEDEPMLRKMTAKLFESEFAMHATTACDPLEAFEVMSAASSDGFDLIVTDFFMPNMNGGDFIRELRARGLTVPVIAVTASTMGTENQQLLEAGASFVGGKPLTKADVELALMACVTDLNVSLGN